MRLSPLFLVCAASLATLAAGQMLTPTVHADPAAPDPVLRIRVQSLHTKQTVSGTELTGRIKNTGRRNLAYTSLVLVFTDASGREIGRGDGYLLAGPVKPGQTAGFRGLALRMPASALVSVHLREAGQAVTIEAPATQLADSPRTAAR